MIKKVSLLLFIICWIDSSSYYSQTAISIDAIEESRCESSGVVYTHATGGTRPYYFRYKPQGAPNSAYSATSQDSAITGLPAGDFTIEVIDNVGNADQIDATVAGDYVLPQIIVDTTIDVSISGASCINDTILGTIESHFNDGRPPYLYQLREGGVSGTILTPFQSSGQFTGLQTGIYTLQAKDSCDLLRTIVGIQVDLVIDPDSVITQLKYENRYNNTSWTSGVIMTPTSCTEGVIGVITDFLYSGDFTDNSGSLDFEHGGDTSFVPFELTGGKAPYTYHLEEVEMHQAIFDFAYGSPLRTYNTNRLGMFFNATQTGFIKAVGFQYTAGYTYRFHLKNNTGTYLNSSNTFTVSNIDEMKLINFNFPISSGNQYELEIEVISPTVTPQLRAYYNGGTFPLTDPNLSFSHMNNGGVTINDETVFNEVVFSSTSNNIVATNSIPKFSNVSRVSDYVIMGRDACGIEIREYYRTNYTPLDSNNIQVNYLYTNCEFEPSVQLRDFNDNNINNLISNQDSYRGVYPYKIEFLQGHGVLPDPVSIDTAQQYNFQRGYIYLEQIFPDYFPLDPTETYRIRVTDECGNFIQKDLNFNLPEKDTFSGLDINFRYCSCFPYINTRLMKPSTEENVFFTIQPLTNEGTTPEPSGTFTWIDYIDLSHSDTFLITTTGECTGVSFYDTVITPFRKDSSWVVINNSSCAEFGGGASVDVFYELYIDDSLLTNPCRLARLYEGDPVNGLSNYLEQKSIINNTANFSGLLPGVYTIDFINECHGYLTFTIKNYNYPELNVTFDPVCAPAVNGGIYAEPLFGVKPYQYQIKPSSSTVYSALQPDSAFLNMPPNTYDIRMEDSCGNSVEQTVTTGVLPKPILTGPNKLCVNSNIYITTAQISGAQYIWRKDGVLLPDTSYFLDIKNATHSDSGSYSLEVVSTGCTSEVDSIHVSTVDDATILDVSSDKEKYCEGEEAILNGSNSGANIAGSWSYIDGPTYYAPINYSTNNPLTIQNLSSTEDDLNNGTDNPYRYRWTINTGICEANRDAYFQVFRYPLTAFAGADIDLCNQNSAELNANYTNYWNGHWEFVSGPYPITFTDTLDPKTEINGLIPDPDEYVLKWKSYNDSNGICMLEDEVEITNYITTSYSYAGQDTSLCGQYTYQMRANDVPNDSGYGTWRVISKPPSTPPSFDNLYRENAIVEFFKPGTYSFVWEVRNGVCEVNTDTVTIFVVIANTGRDISYCLNSDTVPIRMDADSLGGFYGNWETISGPASVVFDTNYQISRKTSTTTIITPPAGLYELEWNLTDSSTCSVFDTLTLLINQTIDTARAGVDLSSCGSEVILLGNNPIESSPRWELVSGPNSPVFSDFDSSLTTVSGLDSGQYLFSWNFYNGSCSSSSDTLIVDVIPSPALYVHSYVNVSCGNAGDGELYVRVVDSISNYLFSLNTKDSLIQSQGLYQNLDVGTYTVFVRDTNTNCHDSIDVQLIGVDTINPTIVCDSINVYLDANGLLTIDTSMVVESVADNCGILNYLFDNGTDTIQINCGVDTVIKTIEIEDINGNTSSCQTRITILDTTSPVISCKDSTLSFSSFPTDTIFPGDLLTTVGDNCGIFDYKINNEDSLVFDCSSLSMNILTIEVTDVNGNTSSCISNFTISNDSISINAGNDSSLCNTTTYLLLANPLSTNESGSWRTIRGAGATLVSSNSSSCSVTGLSEGVYEFEWAVKNTCDSIKDSVVIEIINTTQANAANDSMLCGQTNFELIADSIKQSDAGLWRSLISNPSTIIFSNSDSNITSVSGLIEGIYQFEWNVANKCGNTIDTIEILNDLPSIVDAGNDTLICADNIDVNAALLNQFDSGTWTQSSNNPSIISFSNSTNESTNISGIIDGVYEFIWEVRSLCDTISDTITIEKISSPIRSVLRDTVLCSQTNFDIESNPLLEFESGQWSQLTNLPSQVNFSNSDSNITQISGFIEGNYQVEWQVLNQCNTIRDTITIINNIPSNVDAGNDSTICITEQLTIIGSPIKPFEQAYWTSSSSGISYSDSLSPSTEVYGYDKGVYEFVWTVMSFCETVRDTVQITILKDAANTPISSSSYCDDFDHNLNGSSIPQGYTGFWSLDTLNSVANGVSIANETSQNTTANLTSYGEYSFIWSMRSDVCQSKYDTVQIQVYEVPQTSFSISDNNICEDDCITFTSSSSIVTDIINEYQWSLGNDVFSSLDSVENCYPDSGVFDIQLITTSKNGCSDTLLKTAELTVYSKPIPKFGMQSRLLVGSLLKLQNLGENYTYGNYEIEYGTLPLSTYKHELNQLGDVTVGQFLTNQYGCTDSLFKVVEVYEENGLFVPNSFSPNGDGYNDIFRPVSNIDFEIYTLRIFNRWGELLFETNDPYQGWDATRKGLKVKYDTYIWKLKYKSLGDISQYESSGHVIVIK